MIPFSVPFLTGLSCLVNVSDIFNYFSVRGAGEKEEASEEVAVGSVSIKNRGRGGGFREGGVGGERARWGNVCGERGGGAKYFFSGPKFPPSLSQEQQRSPKGGFWVGYPANIQGLSGSPQDPSQAPSVRKTLWRLQPEHVP